MKSEGITENIKLTKEFISLFSNYNEEEIIKAFNRLQKRQKEILNLVYGLNDSVILSRELISEKLGIKQASISQQVYMAKRKMNEILSSLSDVQYNDLDKDKVNDEIDKNINYEKSTKEKDNSYNENSNNSQDRVAGIINLIKEGKFNAGIINSYNDMLFGVEVFQADCSLAHANTTMLYLDTNRAIKKKCYMYKIVIMNKNKKIIEQKVLIKEKNEKKFYECIYKDELGVYDFDNLESDSIVCFNTENEEKLKVEMHNKSDEKESNKKSLIYYINSLYNRAVDDFNNRKYSDAEEKFEKLLSLTTDETILYNVNVYLGKLYNNIKKFICAEKHFRSALELQQGYNILTFLIQVLVNEGKYDEALKYIDECEKNKGKYTQHLVLKARIYNLKGDSKLAIEILDNCILCDPNDYNVHYEKVKILYEQKSYDKALDEIKKCDEIHPNTYIHKIIKGKIEYILGNVKQAVLIFDMVSDAMGKYRDRNNTLIGYFFHELGEEQLTYEYYNKVSCFLKYKELTAEQINNHYKEHKENKYNEKMHSIFNVDISIEEISELVLKMNKTGVKEFYDIYQIYWPNVGYIQIDEQKTVQEDYLTIYTLPFSKKVMLCHPDFKFSGKIINEPVSREDLEKHPEQKQDENIKLNNDLEKNDIVEEQLLDDRIDEQVSNNIKHDEILKQEDKKEEIINMDNILIEDCINIISLLKNPIYSKFVEKFNPKELLIVLLKLGYVDDNYFSTNEIAAFLNVDEKTIEELTKNALGACKEIINNYVDAAFDKLINEPKILEKSY